MIDLKLSVEKEMDKTRDVIRGFPWENREAYAMWLVQTFHIVNHSTRLVALAGALADLNKNELHCRFVDHAKEERGHQLIAISDLKALGYTTESFPCLAPSASMYQVQYYWIERRGATSFFGYTLALEFLAVTFGAEIHERVLRAHGKDAAKFLKCHAEDDVDHLEKAFKQINTLSAPERVVAQENLELSTSLYRGMLKEVQECFAKASASVKKAA